MRVTFGRRQLLGWKRGLGGIELRKLPRQNRAQLSQVAPPHVAKGHDLLLQPAKLPTHAFQDLLPFGPRFPDMSEAYDAELRARARALAADLRIPLREGVYVAVTGPSLETPAEYRLLRAMGADVVGMSTVPEVIVARHAGMRVLGISVITDSCLPDALEPVNVEQILATAHAAEPSLSALVRGMMERL